MNFLGGADDDNYEFEMEYIPTPSTTTSSSSSLPNNNNNKRKAAEVVIQSLDKDDENNNKEQKTDEPGQPQAQRHVYMEPRALSDLELVYDGVVLHVHKSIMFNHSVYFRTIMEADPDIKRIELPSVNLLMRTQTEMLETEDLAIRFSSFKGFIEYIYRPKSVQYSELFAKNVAEMENVPLCGFYPLICLSHYFNVERIESRMQELIRNFGQSCKENCRHTTKGPGMFYDLFYANAMHWAREEDYLIGLIAPNFTKHQAHKTFSIVWSILSTSLKEKLLLATIAKQAAIIKKSLAIKL